MAENIPDDVMVHILERLPIKSLLRFTCVSKWWRSIILYDHQFAKSQFQRAYETSPTRLLLSTSSDTEFESIDTEMPLTGGSVTKLTCPSEFKQPNHRVRILSSCNGLILAAIATRKYARLFASKFYIWNPSTGFFKKLPDSRNIQCVDPVGFGHLSATDDYKIIVKIQKNEHSVCWDFSEAEMFSSRANIWKKIQVPYSNVLVYGNGFLVNEAIHWTKFPSNRVVIAFDLAKEEFRTIPLPTGVKRAETAKASMFRGCLCIFDCKYVRNPTAGCFDVWVMKEYDMADSWTKLFNFEVNNILYWCLKPLLVTETSTFLDYSFLHHDVMSIDLKLIKIVHHQEEVFETCCSSGNSRYREAIAFEESLLWLR